MASLAENLVAIAEADDVPIEALAIWIHVTSSRRADGWTTADWRRCCREYVEAKREAEIAEASA